MGMMQSISSKPRTNIGFCFNHNAGKHLQLGTGTFPAVGFRSTTMGMRSCLPVKRRNCAGSSNNRLSFRKKENWGKCWPVLVTQTVKLKPPSRICSVPGASSFDFSSTLACHWRGLEKRMPRGSCESTPTSSIASKSPSSSSCSPNSDGKSVLHDTRVKSIHCDGSKTTVFFIYLVQ